MVVTKGGKRRINDPEVGFLVRTVCAGGSFTEKKRRFVS